MVRFYRTAKGLVAVRDLRVHLAVAYKMGLVLSFLKRLSPITPHPMPKELDDVFRGAHEA